MPANVLRQLLNGILSAGTRRKKQNEDLPANSTHDSTHEILGRGWRRRRRRGRTGAAEIKITNILS